TAKAQCQVSCAVDEFAKLPQPRLCPQIEIEAQMRTTLPKMSPDWAAISKLAHQRRQAPKIISHPRRRHSRILPSLQPIGLAWNEHIPRQRRIPNMPDTRRFLGRMDTRHRSARPLRSLARQLFRLRARLLRAPGAHLNQQKSAPLRQQWDVVEIDPLPAHKAHQQRIEALQSDRPVLQRAHYRI